MELRSLKCFEQLDPSLNPVITSSSNQSPVLFLYKFLLRVRFHHFTQFVKEITLCRRDAVVKRVEDISDNCVSQHLSGAGSNPVGSVGRDLNLKKLKYQCLTTSVAVVLVVR